MFKSLLLLVIIFIFYGCSSIPRYSKKEYKIKPSIQRNINSDQIRVLLNSDFKDEYLLFNTAAVLKSGSDVNILLNANEKLKIDKKNNSILVKSKRIPISLSEIEIHAANDNEFIVYNNKKYKGIFTLINPSNNLLVINKVDFEDYVYSVILSELGTRFNEKEIEAIKAFAVCVRNYTLMKLNERKEFYDIYNDVRDQMYNGYLQQSSLVEMAVKQTKNEILKYNGELATVFYHSSCGGYTEDCSHVFNSKSLPYLSGIKDGNDANCNISPNFEWTEKFSGNEILSRLISAKYFDESFVYITSIEIKNTFPSGRINELQVTAVNENGEEKTLSVNGKTIRNVFRSKSTNGILRSSLFEMKPEYNNGKLNEVIINGKGNGHGVGLCQWGTISQARNGKNYKEILSFYFPGTRVEVMK